MSIFAVGACYLDTILTESMPGLRSHRSTQRTSHYPGEDEKLRASSVARRRGGNCPNSLEVLQQLTQYAPLGTEPSLDLIAVLPSKASVASAQIRKAFEPRVRLSHCIYRESFTEPASSYIIKSQSSGSRTIVNYNELPEMTVEEFSQIADDLGSRASWFHFEGRIPDVTLRCIHCLRQRFPPVRISVEVEKPGREGLEELAAEADVIFYSKNWAQHNGYASAEECVRNQAALTRKASLLCCTWGQDGADAFEPANENFAHVAAYSAEDIKVVDPIGAGDTFIAGMLYALNCRDKDWNLSKKLAFANQVAGMKVAQEGFSGLHRALASFA